MINVLVVDDSPVMRRYLGRILQMTGLDIAVHEAEDGQTGISRALSLRPDLIITDLNMPQMNGEELVARVSESPGLKGTPVLVISADRSSARTDTLRQAGATAFLTKPVTPELLRKELLAVVGHPE